MGICILITKNTYNSDSSEANMIDFQHNIFENIRYIIIDEHPFPHHEEEHI